MKADEQAEQEKDFQERVEEAFITSERIAEMIKKVETSLKQEQKNPNIKSRQPKRK